jgi:hypothetical protein
MRSLFIIALFCLVASCGYRGRAAEGTVLEVTNFGAPSEDWKFKPIEGAEIAVYWEGFKPLYSHGGRTYCLAITYTNSDSDGRFHVEGPRVPRAVDGITEITPVSLAYVPGFAQLRPHEHKSSTWADSSTNHAAVHVFRRAEDPNSQDVRGDAFYNAKFCPSEEFQEANKRLQPTRENARG